MQACGKKDSPSTSPLFWSLLLELIQYLELFHCPTTPSWQIKRQINVLWDILIIMILYLKEERTSCFKNCRDLALLFAFLQDWIIA